MTVAILTPEQVREIRQRVRSGRRGHGVRAVARDYHASHWTVWRAVTGKKPYDYETEGTP